MIKLAIFHCNLEYIDGSCQGNVDLNLTWVKSFRVVLEGREIDGPTLYSQNQWHAKNDVPCFDKMGFFRVGWSDHNFKKVDLLKIHRYEILFLPCSSSSYLFFSS